MSSLLSPLRLPPPPPRPPSSSPAAPKPNVDAAFRTSTASPKSLFAQSLVADKIIFFFLYSFTSCGSCASNLDSASSRFLTLERVQRPILSLPPTTGRCGFSKSRGGRCVVPLAMSAAASGDSDGSTRLSMDAIRKLFDGFPQPVKSFPWMRVLWSFQNIICEIVWAVAKYLSVPLLAVTSLSEMSYCAHEGKMGVIPIPVVVGFAVAGCLKDAAEQFSSDLKEGGLPWHLLLIASFFTLLKLPGPSYPYWGRLLIPHLANGGLGRTIWLIFMWYRRPNALPGAS